MTHSESEKGGLIIATPPAPHEFQEGSGLFGSVIPDVVAFIVNVSIFSGDRWKELQRKGIVTATQLGGSWVALGFNAEGLFPWLPLLVQVGWYLAIMALDGYFCSVATWALGAPLTPEWDWGNPVMCLTYLETLRLLGFSWYRFEVAFDLPQGVRPFEVRDPVFVKAFRSTLYLPLPKKRFRQVQTSTGSRRESKGRVDSLVAVYDRGRKIHSSSFLRFELRLSKQHLKAFAVEDLYLPFWWWFEINGEKLARILKRSVPPETLSTDWAALDIHQPQLAHLLRRAGWS